MSTPDGCGCPTATGPQETGPRKVGRRSFLRGALVAGVVGVTGADLFSRYSFAQDASYAGDVLVVLSLRGGFDGLGVVAPVADPAYVAARPNLRLTAAQALPLDRTFGLHPAMAPLLPFWQAGTLGFVHDVGQAVPTRSHFQAMAEMERAAPGSGLRTGWLDRVLGVRATGTAFQATQVGSLTLSPALAGPRPQMSLNGLERFGIDAAWDAAESVKWDRSLRALHAGARPELAAPATAALGALSAVAPLRAAGYTPANGAVYPVDERGGTTDLGRALRDVARLVKARVGLQVACVDWGDWDMHVDAGRPDSGWLAGKLGELSRALAALATDLGPAGMGGVSLVTMSEFGRRVAENGSGGTDHGHGNLMLLMGGGVRGGTVHGPWRGLSPGVLADGDLAGATDYRLVLGELLERRCGTPPAGAVFPGLSGSYLGVARAR